MFNIGNDVLEMMNSFVSAEYKEHLDGVRFFGGCMDCSNSCAENCAYKCKRNGK